MTNMVIVDPTTMAPWDFKVVSFLANGTGTALTRPADTTPYAANDLVASSTTAGSIVVPSITVARVAAGSQMLRRLRLYSNHTTGLSAATFTVRLWSTAPTYTNGDNGAYAIATCGAGAYYLGAFSFTMTQAADGAFGIGVPATGEGTEAGIALASGSVVYWDLQTISGFTPQSAKTFTLIAEAYQN